MGGRKWNGKNENSLLAGFSKWILISSLTNHRAMIWVYVCTSSNIFIFIYSSGWEIFFQFYFMCFLVEGIECLATSPLWLLKGFSNLFLFPSSSSSSYLSYFFDFSPVNNLWCFKFLFFSFSFSILNFVYFFIVLGVKFILLWQVQQFNVFFLCLENFFYYLFLLCCASSSFL